MQRVAAFILSPIVKFFVKVLPLSVANKLIKHLPTVTTAKFVGIFKFTRVYRVLLFDTEFLLESGPGDDHFLELEKNRLRNWENDVLSIWVREVSNAEIVIDIGAYLGVYSILAAKLGCPKVLAIEPNSKNFSKLQKNLSLNHVAPSVESHKVALGAKSRLVSMLTPIGRPNSSGSQVADSPTGRDLGAWEVESEVEMTTLDSFLVDQAARVSVIKIDTEGYELMILQGGSKILISDGPCMLIELLDQEKKSQVDYYLSGFGYSQGLPIEKSASCTNFLYKK
jgi:FkbM family methyltransferase